MSSIERPEPFVIFQDAHLLAVDKPPGISVQPDRTGDPSLLDLLRDRHPEVAASLGSPHRLDRPVSGVVLFTKDEASLRRMDERFRKREVGKTYLALVEGSTPDHGEASDVLHHAGGARKAVLARDVRQSGGREVRLTLRTLARGDRFSLLEVRPEGGAFHQIRAQLSALGHPIKGDVKYGARRGEPDRSIALHAWKLRFGHPFTGVQMDLEAPLPARSIWPALLALRG